MNSLSCEESPKITKLIKRNRISFLVLAERIDMIFSAPFDDFRVWTSGFFGRFKSCCIFNSTFSLFFCKVAKSIWGLNWFLRFKRVVQKYAENKGGIKVEKILKGSLDLISSPSPSVKIQIMGGKVCWQCPAMFCLYTSSKLSCQ